MRCLGVIVPALTSALTFILLSSPATAQWSADPANNLTIADRTGEQVQPKVRPTSDGGCYVSWFDNSTGGYDVYLQRLNAYGVEQWAHNGIILADRGVSSTVDYDLVVDSLGNAVITYNDDTLVAGSQQIVVQKVDPAGNKLWGATGVNVSGTNTNFKGNPRVVTLSDGNFVVGWSESPTGSAQVWILQKLDAAGIPLLAPITVSEASRYLALSDMQPGDSGSVIALWIRGTTANPITSAKALYSQKYDGTGAPLWNAGSPVIVFNTTSVQNGYFPTMLPDGAGGAVYGWYEIGGSRNAYIQHVLSAGTLKFAAPVANTGVTAGRIRISAGLAYNVASGEYYLCSTESGSPTQGNYSVIAQKFNSAGARQWTDSGALVLPTGTGNQSNFVQCQVMGDGCVVAGIDSRTATTGVIFAARVLGNGTIPWSNLPSSTIDTKSRLASTLSTRGFVILGWGNRPFGSVDIQVQDISQYGTFGICGIVCPADINCDGMVTSQDFFDFLSAFFSNSLTADFNHDGMVTSQDFFDFIAAFFTGCP